MKLLCAADLHLGRQPSRVPARLRGAALGPAAAWHRLVDLAFQHEVAAVLLAGDVLDDDNDLYEAFADLRAGVERLVEAGVEVVAVAGNHDMTALPRLVGLVPGMRLLGAGGSWECVRIEVPGAAVNVLGWSFPSANVTESPLASLDVGALEIGPGLTLGLLHADLDGSSRYAPVTSAELERAPVAAWLLGHVHKPHPLQRARVGYLGSLSAADPGEEGLRGAWLVSVAAGELEIEHVGLSPLRYERVEVDLSEMDDLSDLDALVVAAIEAAAGRCHADDRGLQALGCRVELRGRTPFASEVSAHLESSDLASLAFDAGSVSCFVHDVVALVSPELDLAGLAAGTGPLALAARGVLALREPLSPVRRQLIAEASEALAGVAGLSAYEELEPVDLGEVVGELLEEAALRSVGLMQEALEAASEGPAP